MTNRSRTLFVMASLIALTAKLWLAIALPLFGDEAFYWQEGQHLAWAYSDLPGLTAWLARLGVELGGNTSLGLRWPFLLLGAAIPWQVARISARWFGAEFGWRAGLIALLMPLSGTLGVFALPDVPLTFASLLCLDALARQPRALSWSAYGTLAAGLVLGALSHYRFAAVVGAGLVGLLLSTTGRTILRDKRLWVAVAIGAVAWLPLLLWNLAHGNSGLHFQLVERHPWAWHADGLWYPVIQAVGLTPLVFFALVQCLYKAWTKGVANPQTPPWSLLLGAGGTLVVGYFVLGFATDSERVSFHWPLVGWLALTAAVPVIVAQWKPLLRRTLWATLVFGASTAFAAMAVVASPKWRADMADSRWYQDNFAGWSEVAAATARRLRVMPPETRVMADNFMLGAQLGFALDNPNIAVLDHPLNHKHGRAPQLVLWGLDRLHDSSSPRLVVVEDTTVKLRDRLARYRELCRVLGGFPPAQLLHVDHGRKRFLMFALGSKADTCAMPALAHIDVPVSGGAVPPHFSVQGWAVKDGRGIARVKVTLDGKPVATARYGLAKPDLKTFLPTIADSNYPAVGFNVEIHHVGVPGRHWLGLTLETEDGRIEQWPEQRVLILPSRPSIADAGAIKRDD